MRSDIKEQACLHQKALLFSVGGLFYTVAISALELEKQLHRLSANRLANDQLAKVLNPQKVGR